MGRSEKEREKNLLDTHNTTIYCFISFFSYPWLCLYTMKVDIIGGGLMHSPAIGLSLSEMILNKPTTFDLKGYQLNRTPQVEKYVI